MNKNKLKSIMVNAGDNCKTLASSLNIARSTFSAKINETNNAEFSLKEMKIIKEKYNLTPEEINNIFFE